MLGSMLAVACRADISDRVRAGIAILVLLEEALLRREGVLLHLRLHLDTMLAVLPLHTGGVTRRRSASQLVG